MPSDTGDGPDRSGLDLDLTEVSEAGVPTSLIVRPASLVQRRALNFYTFPRVNRDSWHFDHVALWGGTMATALVAGLVAMLGFVSARALLGVDIISPRGDGAYETATAYRVTVLAALAALVAGALAQSLAYVSPRPLLFLRLITSLSTAVFALWPFTTAAGALAKVASALVYLSIGTAVSRLTAIVTHHACPS